MDRHGEGAADSGRQCSSATDGKAPGLADVLARDARCGVSVTRPILRYHGAKWKLAPWIIANMPAHTIYCEPFGGSGSVLLQKKRCGAEVLNDLDGELVRVFRVLQDPGKAEMVRRRLAL